MTRRWITCPESAHLEQVDLEDTEQGLVVTGCTYLARVPGRECPRECARRLDVRARIGVDDRLERVLVVIAADDGPAAMIARHLVDTMMRDDLHVEVAIADRATPPPSDYDCVVIGAGERLGSYPRAVLDFARRHNAELAAMPTAVFVVCTAVCADVTERVAQRFGWRPATCACFATISNAAQVNAFALAIEDVIAPLDRVPY